MSNLWPAIGSDTIALTVTDRIPKRTDSLRTLFSSNPAPSSYVAYQLWQDSSTGALYQRDSANANWIPLRRQLISGEYKATLGTVKLRLCCSPVPLFVNGILLVSDTTTVSSVTSSKEYTFNLRLDNAALDLRAAALGTGVGELLAEQPLVVPTNQNQTVIANRALQLVVVKTGAPTAVNALQWTLDAWQLLT